MYTQTFGCFVMGFAVTFKKQYFDQTSSRLHKAIYLGITSGLCGSITSFSSWQMECNKSFLLQWDLSWGNIIGSYNGGRFLEWFFCMWTGVVVPISALRFGYFCGKYFITPPTAEILVTTESKIHNTGSDESMKMESKHLEIENGVTPDFERKGFYCLQPLYEESVFLLFVVIIILVTVLPGAVYREWIHLTYSAGNLLFISSSSFSTSL